MDSLALLAEVEAIIAQGDTDADPLLVAYAAVEVLPRVVKGGGLMEDGLGGHLELRDCQCGSTLARPVGAPFLAAVRP